MSRHGIGGFRAKPGKDNPHDFFPTPPGCTKAIMGAIGDTLPSEGLWCEPAVGGGAIVDAIGRRHWHTYDIRDVEPSKHSEYHKTRNWLEHDVPAKTYDVIITNPPFYLAEQFVRAAIARATHVVMLLRLAFLETRKREALHLEHPSDVYVMSRRPSFMANGATDSTAYAWFVWGPGRGNRWHLLVTPETNKRGLSAP